MTDASPAAEDKPEKEAGAAGQATRPQEPAGKASGGKPPQDAAKNHSSGGEHRHRGLIATIFVLATILGFFACFALWVNRQLLNTDNWTKTSSNLIANEHIDEALSTFAVNQLYESVNIEEHIKSNLPKQIQGLSGPAAAGLKQLAYRAVPQLLATAPVQEAWRKANQTAHAELIHILNGGSKVLSTKQGVVSLNLHELVTQLAAQLGVQNQLATVRSKLSGTTGETARSTAEQKLGVTLPSTSGELVIMRSSQLKTAQDVVKAIRGLAIVLPLLSVLLFALAIWLSHGRRRVALRTTGWCFFGVGLVLLIARRIAGDQVVNGLVQVPANRPAAQAAWSIGTSLLYDLALAVLVYGLVIIAAAWLGGRTRPARSLRQAIAPFSREHANAMYGIGAGILLLVILWGPTPATRQLIPIIGLAIVGAIGIYTLRKQTADEFPDAQRGEAMLRMRGAAATMRDRGQAALHGQGAASGQAGADSHARFDALERLSELHDRGTLTDEEYAAEKSRLLNGS